MKAFLRRPGVRQLLHKRPWTVIRAALRRIGARNARNYMRAAGLVVPERQERQELRERNVARRRRLCVLAGLAAIVL